MTYTMFGCDLTDVKKFEEGIATVLELIRGQTSKQELSGDDMLFLSEVRGSNARRLDKSLM